MDSIDYEILKYLKKNGRMTHEKIAQAVNLSRPAVRNRVIAMEDAGVIEGYSTRINYDVLGFNIQVLVYVKVMSISYEEVMKQIHARVPDRLIIEDQFRLSGEWCILLRVMCHYQEDITLFVDRVIQIENVVATNTVLIFKS
ncbi:Lrp/AsnC family transcriptional regulator [Anoxynatronum buryatiense]|uniref:Lrp/AsnC family transcriptional regulator, leucine-responsive regulatory protein n=1 Tax=Anoxynatronum buryatiense TaxID=489973 RepID=A0AA45WU69_9CLOT|nr:Lrp/AsnC family transcriptional regulator [Anoxynatronum buryatiense]SMP45672.1 Lrp/AsnC family transcriptional regulator, leucine-responsive regulatory protein [Anoxynatronum buryatiense]